LRLSVSRPLNLIVEFHYLMDATATLVPQFPLLDHVRAHRYGWLCSRSALFAGCIGLFTFAVDPFQHPQTVVV
jgi:hypothetical protein